ncbi:MAG TPA: hypothetical protein VK509_17260 [Polyangiales bacterium]|nr:hypothetical protein [Polyangiales bacterium]
MPAKTLPSTVTTFLSLAAALAALAFYSGEAHAQSLRISGDLDYAAELAGREAGIGGGGALRAGAQLDLIVATLILEGGGSYHGFGGDDEVNVWRGLAGGEVRIGKILEPGLFAHAGVGHLSGVGAFTAPAVDVGLALDLTIIPLIDIGAHVAYNALLGNADRDGFSWLTAGLHAALVI